MKKDFNDFYWHDSSIEKIYLDRATNREIDTVNVTISWINGYKSTLIFNNVYKIDLKMNFGIKGEENILCAEMNNNDDFFLSFAPIIKLYNLKFELNCFIIETNTSASMIKIIAKNFDEIII